MSQAKVDQRRLEKRNRKQLNKKAKNKKIIIRTVIGVVLAFILGWTVWSIGISSGLIEKPKKPMTTEEKESLRDVLIQKGDPNVKYDETTVAETTTVAE